METKTRRASAAREIISLTPPPPTTPPPTESDQFFLAARAVSIAPFQSDGRVCTGARATRPARWGTDLHKPRLPGTEMSRLHHDVVATLSGFRAGAGKSWRWRS